MPATLSIGKQWNAPQQLLGICIMNHTLWLSGIERRIRSIQEDQETCIRKSHLWPFVPQHKTTSIAMLILSTNEDSFNHLFRGVNVNQLTWVLTSRRGASPTHNNSIWMKESTLECSPLNLSLHTWCKVIGSTWVRTQHCSFSRDKMVHSRHLSTIVQELINVHTSLSPPRPRTSPPSPHWLQQYANHVSTGSYLVTIIAPTQCREQAPDQIC